MSDEAAVIVVAAVAEGESEVLDDAETTQLRVAIGDDDAEGLGETVAKVDAVEEWDPSEDLLAQSDAEVAPLAVTENDADAVGVATAVAVEEGDSLGDTADVVLQDIVGVPDVNELDEKEADAESVVEGDAPEDAEPQLDPESEPLAVPSSDADMVVVKNADSDGALDEEEGGLGEGGADIDPKVDEDAIKDAVPQGDTEEEPLAVAPVDTDEDPVMVFDSRGDTVEEDEGEGVTDGAEDALIAVLGVSFGEELPIEAL